jgi:hypothetical protein
MSFSVYLAAPVHIEALESRFRRFGIEMCLPTDAELNECGTLNSYYRMLDSRGFRVNDQLGVARLDPKGFISEVEHRCTWLAHLAAEEFGTYVVYDQQIYTQEGEPTLEEDEDRDRWWRLQASWEKEAHKARVQQFAANVRSLHAGLPIDVAPESFLGRLTQAAAKAADMNAELLVSGDEELLLARAEEALNPNRSWIP